MGETFVDLPAKIREYNGTDYASFSATTNIVGKPYKGETEETCAASWPEKIGEFTPEELGVGDKSALVWRPVKIRDMYGSPIDPMLMHEAKNTHEIRKLLAGACLYVRGVTTLRTTVSPLPSTSTASTLRLTARTSLTRKKLQPSRKTLRPREVEETFFVKRKREDNEESAAKKPCASPEDPEAVEPF